MNTFYVICTVVVVVMLLGFVLLPVAKAKGWINKLFALKIAKGVDTSIDVVQAIIKAAELKKVNFGAINAVFDLADITTDFIVDLIDSEASEEKINLTLNVVDKVLKEIGITPTDAQQRMIKIVVEQGVEFFLTKKQKNEE